MPRTTAIEILNEIVAEATLDEQLSIEDALAALRESVARHGHAGEIALVLLWAEVVAGWPPPNRTDC